MEQNSIETLEGQRDALVQRLADLQRDAQDAKATLDLTRDDLIAGVEKADQRAVEAETRYRVIQGTIGVIQAGLADIQDDLKVARKREEAEAAIARLGELGELAKPIVERFVQAREAANTAMKTAIDTMLECRDRQLEVQAKAKDILDTLPDRKAALRAVQGIGVDSTALVDLPSCDPANLIDGLYLSTIQGRLTKERDDRLMRERGARAERLERAIQEREARIERERAEQFEKDEQEKQDRARQLREDQQQRRRALGLPPM